MIGRDLFASQGGVNVETNHFCRNQISFARHIYTNRSRTTTAFNAIAIRVCLAVLILPLHQFWITLDTGSLDVL